MVKKRGSFTDRFDAIASRLITSVSEELAATKERVAKDAEDITQDAESHLNDIRAGERQFKRPFRP